MELIALIKSKGYRSDPVKAWKAKVESEEANEEDRSGEEQSEGPGEEKDDYNYLLSMELWSLTLERKEELLKKRDAKVCWLQQLKIRCVLIRAAQTGNAEVSLIGGAQNRILRCV